MNVRVTDNSSQVEEEKCDEDDRAGGVVTNRSRVIMRMNNEVYNKERDQEDNEYQ